MAKPKTTPPLEQNPYVKELLDVLKKYNPPGAEDLQGMIANTVKIEQQLDTALAEMAIMRRELATIREDNHPMRNSMQNAVNAIQERVQLLREQLETLKGSIVEGCKNALADFKEHGTVALNGIVKFFNVKPALEAMAKSCDQAAKENMQSINKIERISKEYHKTGQHFKNVGRAMTGKELIRSAKPVGKVAKAVESPLKAVRICNLAMRDAARNAVKSLSRLEKAADRPKPIKEQLDTATKQAAVHNTRKTPEKTKSPPAPEL